MTDTPENAPLNSESPALAAELATLQARLDEAEARAAAARDAHLRALADLDNVRKRAEREADAARKFGSEKLLGELLSICDSLALGLDAARKPEAQVATLVEGLQLTEKQLMAMLEKHGVSLIDPKGLPFNPELHEAVSMAPSNEVAPNHVLTVMQRGYRLHERLLRPAMVIVARAG